MRQFWKSLPVEMQATTTCAGKYLPFGETMTNPVLVEVLRGDIVESVHRGAVGDCRWRRQGGPRDRRYRDAGLPALCGQGDPGAAAGRDGCCRRIWFRRQGTGAGLRLAFRRGQSMSNWRAQCLPGQGSMKRRSNAARIGLRTTMRPLRWRAPAKVPISCTTTVRESTPVSCAFAATRRSATAAMCNLPHPFQQLVAETMEQVTGARHGLKIPRHRRLLDPDLCGAAEKPRFGLCQDGHWQRTGSGARQSGQAPDVGLHGASRFMSLAPAGSARN